MKPFYFSITSDSWTGARTAWFHDVSLNYSWTVTYSISVNSVHETLEWGERSLSVCKRIDLSARDPWWEWKKKKVLAFMKGKEAALYLVAGRRRKGCLSNSMSGFICRELFMALSNCCNIPAAATTLFLAASLALTNQLPGEEKTVK